MLVSRKVVGVVIVLAAKSEAELLRLNRIESKAFIWAPLAGTLRFMFDHGA